MCRLVQIGLNKIWLLGMCSALPVSLKGIFINIYNYMIKRLWFCLCSLQLDVYKDQYQRSQEENRVLTSTRRHSVPMPSSPSQPHLQLVYPVMNPVQQQQQQWQWRQEQRRRVG